VEGREGRRRERGRKGGNREGRGRLASGGGSMSALTRERAWGEGKEVGQRERGSGRKEIVKDRAGFPPIHIFPVTCCKKAHQL